MLSWHVTGLWYPGDTRTVYYGQIPDPEQGLVTIPRNDGRRAEVTVRTNKRVLLNIMRLPYARCLKVYYYDHLVFWGPIILHDVDMRTGTVKLQAVDPSIRMIFHQVRRGDLGGIFNSANDDTASITSDYVGLRLLRDAALNTTAQTTRGVPDLGVVDGTNTADADPDSKFTLHRGDQVFSSMLDLVNSTRAAVETDFALTPTDTETGAYCTLDTIDPATYADLAPAGIGFHFGTGLQNLENLRYTDGGQYITHVHALSRDLKYRVTSANAEASALTGPYVQWDASSQYADDADPADVEAVLAGYGRQVLRAFSRPLIEATLDLPVEHAGSFRYLDDYNVGDSVPVAGKSGVVELEEGQWEINQVALRQDGADNRVKPELVVASDRVATLGDDVSGTEE